MTSKTKGIVLAGGTGSRMFPITKGTVKQLLHLYNKPMVYYPIATLIEAGIQDILIVTRPQDQESFINLLGDGSDLGINIQFATQPEPKGLAQAFTIADECGFLGDSPACMVLGDNIFHGGGFSRELKSAVSSGKPTIFGYLVSDQTSYGVVQIDPATQLALSIEEKPQANKENGYAVPGVYLFPSGVAEVARNVTPSARGEVEITSVIEHYLNLGNLKVKLMLDDAWLDTGTFDSMADATDYVRVVEKRTGRLVGSIEVAALGAGFMSEDQFNTKITDYQKSGYGKALSRELELFKRLH
jgi:glucose-1-phosphate thymidylyltransferase